MLAACGGGGDAAGPATTAATAGGADPTADDLALAVFTPPPVAGRPTRVAFGIADRDGILGDVPPSVEVRWATGTDFSALGPPVTVQRHEDGVPRPYYTVEATFEEVGAGVLLAELDDGLAEAAVNVIAPSEAAVPTVGEPMAAVETPTVDDPRGVDPICTHRPPCPLHDVSLDAALGEDRPVVLLISTPAYCQTQVCGPVLDLALEASERHGEDVRFVHAEVWTSDELAEVTEAVRAFGLAQEGFEPALFVADAGGTLTARYDGVFDRAELADALATVT